jgi:tetratricopeptide (TPR) repeat protein
MRKMILSGVVILSASLCMAQNAKVLNAYNYLQDGELLKAKAEIDPATTHVKTSIDGKTWYYRGQIYDRIYLYDKQEPAPEDKDKFAEIRVGALTEGINSYKKSIELGSKRINMNEVRGRYQLLGGYAYQEGVNAFNNETFDIAADFFQMCYDVRISEGVIDSAAIFNAGIGYMNSAQYEKARTAFDRTLEVGYNIEQSYINKANTYDQEGNKEMYKQTLADARKALPNNQSLVTAEINIYLENKEYDKALDNLNIAITNDPNNKTLFFARGNILDNQQTAMLEEGKKEEAKVTGEKSLSDYKKALEIDPEFFDAAYSIGALIFNQGAAMLNDANSLTDDTAYKKAKEAATLKLSEALPYLEKAHEIKPEDVSTMTSLKDLYARTNQMDKYEEMSAKLKN